MKKFLWKLVFFSCIIGTGIVVINFFYKQSLVGPKDVPESLQLVNFGSSHGYYGLCYEALDEELQCFNFAMSGQMLSYDLRLLEMYRGKLDSGGVCIIPVSWFSFVYKEEDVEGFETKNARYYTILSGKYIKQYSLREDLQINLLPVLYAGDEIFVHKWLPIKDINGFFEKEREERWYRTAEDMDLVENAQNAYQGLVLNWNNVILDDEVEALYELIDICWSEEVTPVLVTFPLMKELNDCADENLDIVFYDVLREVTGTTGVEWYDYSKDARFMYNRELFIDCHHLNYEGAKIFTEILWEEVIAEKFAGE